MESSIVVAIIGLVGAVIVALIQKSRKENKTDHNIVAQLLEVVHHDIIKVEDVLRQKDIDQRNLDLENRSIEDELNIIKNRQKDLEIEESAELKQARIDSQEVVAKEKELKDAIKDSINCVNGR